VEKREIWGKLSPITLLVPCMTTLDAFFATVKLPTLSQVAQSLVKTLQDEDAGLPEIRDIIAQDPALTAKLLRLANSAQFGLPRGVGSIDEALQMVGMSRVRSLALGACVADCFPRITGLDAGAFWRSCMTTGGYAHWLAQQLRMDVQQAWLTGMMLRLGELLMAQVRPECVPEIEQLPALPGARWEREHRLLGYAEGQVTAELARRWNFPMQIVQALERTYDPLVEQAFSRLGAVVHLAGLLSDMPNPNADALEQLPTDVMSALGLQAGALKPSFPAKDSFLQLN
jgi:HD-like signal output (HDOD) protein